VYHLSGCGNGKGRGKPRVRRNGEMQGEQVIDSRYNRIDKAVCDMAAGTVKLRHIGYLLLAFAAPLTVGVLAMGAVS
jgi:hypothetical protein